MINDASRLVGYWVTATVLTIIGLAVVAIIYELEKELSHGNRTEART